MSTATKAPRTPKAPGTPKATRTNGSGTARTGDPIVDQLNDYGFEFTLETLDLSKIDRKQSRLNQARIDAPINEDQVLLYAQGMEQGHVFPPIVVHQLSNGQYVVMDGNHRVAAYDLNNIAEAQAYIVTNPTPAQVTSYVYEANTRHGLPTSMEDRIRQAIYLVETLDVKPREAAASLQIPFNKLAFALENYNAERRFEALNNRKVQALHSTAKRTLDSIRSDDVLKPAASLVVEAGITGADLGNFVKRINEQRSEREQMKVIQAEREARAANIKVTAGGRIPVPLVLQTLARISSTANNVDSEKVQQALRGIPADARADYARAASLAGNHFIELSMLIRRFEGE